MRNDRPIENRKLQKALNEVKGIMAKYGFAGACMLVAEEEAAFTYGLTAPWSGFRPDPAAPLGCRLRINSDELGHSEAHRRASGAAHSVCQLADFGAQTMDWMEQLKLMMRQNGLEFDHVPFNGQPPGSLVAQDKPPPAA